VARWLLAIQQYDIKSCHIKGAHNVLADVLSRNPSDLRVAEKRQLTQPRTIMTHAMKLKYKYDDNVHFKLHD
jgi:hypothetical protein